MFVLGGFTCSYRLGAREHAMMLIWCRCSMLLPMQVVTIQLVDLYSKNVKMPTWKIHDSQSSTVFHFVFSVWLALVFDIPSSKIRFRVRAIERGDKTEPIHMLGKTTFNPIYSFIYQSTVGQSRSEYTFYVDVYGGSILRGFHMTLFIIYLFGCNRVHGNKYLQVSMFEFVSRKMHSTKIDWTCLKCSIAASKN